VIKEPGEEEASCPGSAADPQAIPGHMCIYVETLLEANTLFKFTRTSGLLLGFVTTEAEEEPTGAVGFGTWAATAP
jgi:hypothetical protein